MKLINFTLKNTNKSHLLKIFKVNEIKYLKVQSIITIFAKK